MKNVRIFTVSEKDNDGGENSEGSSQRQQYQMTSRADHAALHTTLSAHS